MTVGKFWAMKFGQARRNLEYIIDRRNIRRDRGVDILGDVCDECYMSRSLCDRGKIFCNSEL